MTIKFYTIFEIQLKIFFPVQFGIESIAYFCTCKLTANAKLGEALHRYVQGLWQHTEFKEEMPDGRVPFKSFVISFFHKYRMYSCSEISVFRTYPQQMMLAIFL